MRADLARLSDQLDEREYAMRQLERRIAAERQRKGDDWTTRDQRRAAEQLRYARWDYEDAEDDYLRACQR